MKRINSIVILVLMMLMGNVVLAQNMHNAKVKGIISIGSKDVATINDLNTGFLYKTAMYAKDLLVTNEIIQLDFNNNDNEKQAKVVKPNLNANIMAFKETSPPIQTGNNNPAEFQGNLYEFIGLNHNIGLDYVYNKLLIDKSNGVDMSINNQDFIITLIKKYTIEFALSKAITNNVDANELEQIIDEVIELRLANSTSNNANLYYPEQSHLLTDWEKKSLDIMNGLINENDFNTTLENLLYIKQIWTDQDKCSSTKDLISTTRIHNPLVAVEIGINSFTYWTNQENITKWRTLIGNTDTDLFSFWGDVGKDDINGGLAGGLVAVGVNLIPGAGQIAYGTAIIGGAAGNSLITIFKSFW